MKIEVIGKNGFTPSAANREYAEALNTEAEEMIETYSAKADAVFASVNSRLK